MGDSREVPHVNIVRKLRHSCEDVNFASSIYSVECEIVTPLIVKFTDILHVVVI